MNNHTLLITIDSLGLGGAETMLVNIANGLSRQRFALTVVSLSNDNPLADRLSKAVRFITAPRRWRFDMQPARAIRRLIVQSGIRTVLCFDLFDYYFVRRACLQLAERPRVFIGLHRTLPDSTKDFFQTHLYARQLEPQDILVVTSRAQVEVLSRLYGIGRDRFRIIYNGIDTEHFKPSRVEEAKGKLRQNIGIPDADFVILQVANFTRAKDHENSFLALQDALRTKSGQSFRLMLAGTGPAGRIGHLRRLASNLGIKHRVTFLGAVQDVLPYYKLADCFTLSSCTEALPVAALEAMAMGLPCVLTDAGGARELVREGIDGHVVPVRDPRLLSQAWLDIMGGPDWFSAEGTRKRICDYFSFGQCLKAYERMLDS